MRLLILIACISAINAGLAGNFMLTGIDGTGGILYDSNPFSLSDGENFPLAVENDFAIYGDLGIDARLLKIGKYTLRSSFSVSGSGYMDNTAKSFVSVAPKLTVIRKGGWASLSYSYSPKIAIRPVLDEDDGLYKFPEYHKNNILLRAGVNPFGKFWGELELLRGLNYYDKSFLEYDRESWSHGAAIRYSGDFYARAGYTLTHAKCRAYDTQGETKQNSDETDGSFDQDAFDLTLGYSLRKLGIRFGASLSNTYFTTEKTPAEDPLHSTRVDKVYSEFVNLSYKIGKKITAETGLDLEQRRTESKVTADLPDLRDYDRTRIKFGISYSFK